MLLLGTAVFLFYENEEHADDDRHEDDCGQAAAAAREVAHGPDLAGGEGGQKRPVLVSNKSSWPRVVFRDETRRDDRERQFFLVLGQIPRESDAGKERDRENFLEDDLLEKIGQQDEYGDETDVDAVREARFPRLLPVDFLELPRLFSGTKRQNGGGNFATFEQSAGVVARKREEAISKSKDKFSKRKSTAAAR